MRSVNFTKKPSFFRKLNLTPGFNFRKVELSGEIGLGLDLPNDFEFFGGTRNRTTDNSKNRGD